MFGFWTSFFTTCLYAFDFCVTFSVVLFKHFYENLYLLYFEMPVLSIQLPSLLTAIHFVYLQLLFLSSQCSLLLCLGIYKHEPLEDLLICKIDSRQKKNVFFPSGSTIKMMSSLYFMLLRYCPPVINSSRTYFSPNHKQIHGLMVTASHQLYNFLLFFINENATVEIDHLSFKSKHLLLLQFDLVKEMCYNNGILRFS